MAQQYENYGTTSTAIASPYDDLYAGDLKRVEEPVTVPASTAAMSRGQLLTATFEPVATGGTPVGVLAIDTPAVTTGNTFQAYMYVTGEFNQAKLTGFEEGMRAGLEAKNIYPKTISPGGISPGA